MIGHPAPLRRGVRKLRILAIGLLFSQSFRANLRCVPDPQLELQLVRQTLKPACVPTGFHPDPHLSCLECPVKLLSFLAVSQSPFLGLAGFCVHQYNLLKSRMIVTTCEEAAKEKRSLTNYLEVMMTELWERWDCRAPHKVEKPTRK
jgi:hypothetical protein